MSDGPWDNEPNHVMFMSEAGYICEIKRHPTLKHLNGYIYIPFGHPDYGKTYHDLHGYGDGGMYEDAPDVHGGWTYSHNGGDDDGGKFTIFGFDCGHAGDLSPGLREITGEREDLGEVYRDIAFVTAQLERAAEQFKQRKEKK